MVFKHTKVLKDGSRMNSCYKADNSLSRSIKNVVLSAYDVATGLAEWRHVAAALAATLTSPSLAILLFDDRNSVVDVLAATRTIAPERIETYRAIVRRMSNHPGKASRRGGPGSYQPGAIGRTSGEAIRWNSLSEAEPDHYVAGMSVVGVSESRWLCVGVDIVAPVAIGEVHAKVDLVLPHFCRAAEISCRLRIAAERSAFTDAVFDRLPVGLVQLDHNGAIIYSNAEADRLSRLREGFKIVSRQFCAASPIDNAVLQAAIREAVDSAKAPVFCWLNVKRGKSRHPYRLLVTATSRSRAVNGNITCRAVFIIDPERPSTIRAEAIADAFGLTVGEAKVVAHLTTGMPLSDIANNLKVSINTIRTLLARAMKKTATHTQATLLRLVLTTLSLVSDKPRSFSASRRR